MTSSDAERLDHFIRAALVGLGSRMTSALIAESGSDDSKDRVVIRAIARTAVVLGHETLKARNKLIDKLEYGE